MISLSRCQTCPWGYVRHRPGMPCSQLAIYLHLHTAVKGDEYKAVSISRKMEVFRAFNDSRGHEPNSAREGLWRADILGEQGLIRAQSKEANEVYYWYLLIAPVTSLPGRYRIA